MSSMTWLKTLRQIAILFFVVMMVVLIIYNGLSLLGKAQVFHRLDHPVLKKISSSIYLSRINQLYSFDNLDNKDLPSEIKTMIYIQIKKRDPEIQIQKKGCLFLDFLDSIEDLDWLNKTLKNLSQKDCVFVNSPDLRMKAFFAEQKPRWFYNQTEVDLQKSQFLASIGLESLAPLKGDFVVFNKPRADILDRLFNEVQKRQMVTFFFN